MRKEPQYRHFALTTKAALKMAKDLLDRFFRDAEGKTNRQIDVYFTLEDMGIQRDKADESLEYLTSRGLINMFGPDIAFLTDSGVNAASLDKDISKLPKAVRDFAAAKPQNAPAAPAPGAQKAPPPEKAPTPVPKLPRSDMPRLTYTDPDGIQHVVELGWTCTIGRVEGNTIHLNDQRASKKHAELRFEGGHYVIKDLGAANGTLVNGSYIDEQPLEHSDQILIGRTTLSYTCPVQIHEPPGPRPGAEESTSPGPEEKSRPDAPMAAMAHVVETERPAIKVVKGRPDSRRSMPAQAQAQARSQEPADLFEDVRHTPIPALHEPAIPPFPPPGEGDLFAEPARRPQKRDPRNLLNEKERSEDLFEAKAKPRPEDEDDLFADTISRSRPRSDDLFSDQPSPRHDRDAQMTPREEPVLDDLRIESPEPDTAEPIFPIDPLAPMDEAPPAEAQAPQRERKRGAKSAEPWSEERTPADAILAEEAKALDNPPVQGGDLLDEPPVPREVSRNRGKRRDAPAEEAATLMVSREDIFPLDEAQDGDVPVARGASEADTNLELENTPDFPRPALEDPSRASTDDVSGQPSTDDLQRWGEDHAAAGSHPRFGASRTSSHPPTALKGEELPDADLSLPDASMASFPAAHDADKRKTVTALKPDSEFHKLIQYLRARVERVDLPDRDQLLDALDLIEHHPYIRVALNLSDTH